MLALAFYKGRGDLIDWTIRRATRSIYSHVELTFHSDDSRRLSVSSSGRDGGVRAKVIDYHPDRWTLVELDPWYDADALDLALSQVGCPYDWTAIALTWAIPARISSPSGWLCSELCAWALGITDTQTCAPGDLFARVQDLNAAWQAGRDHQAVAPAAN